MLTFYDGMEETKFCTGCGVKVEPGMQYCPQYGKVVKGSAADEEFQEQVSKFNEAMMVSRRNWLIFLLAIYAIPVIISTIISLVDANAIANSIWTSDSFQQWLTEHGYTYTQADVKNCITTAAGLGLVSGILAAVSCFCVAKRKYWVVAFVTCFISAAFCFWSIFGMIIGLLVGWLIVSSKDLFTEDPAFPYGKALVKSGLFPRMRKLILIALVIQRIAHRHAL